MTIYVCISLDGVTALLSWATALWRGALPHSNPLKLRPCSEVLSAS